MVYLLGAWLVGGQVSQTRNRAPRCCEPLSPKHPEAFKRSRAALTLLEGSRDLVSKVISRL